MLLLLLVGASGDGGPGPEPEPEGGGFIGRKSRRRRQGGPISIVPPKKPVDEADDIFPLLF